MSARRSLSQQPAHCHCQNHQERPGDNCRSEWTKGHPTGPVKFGFYFRFGAKDWFGKAEAGGRCTTMKPRFDPWWQLLQAAVSLS